MAYGVENSEASIEGKAAINLQQVEGVSNLSSAIAWQL